MPLVTTKEMFEKAYKGGYAVGAFNVNNMEIVQGITEAAGELNAPLILQVSKGARNYANHTYHQQKLEVIALPLVSDRLLLLCHPFHLFPIFIRRFSRIRSRFPCGSFRAFFGCFH